MQTASSARTWIALALSFAAFAMGCAPEADESVSPPDEQELRAELSLEETLDLPLGAPFDQGEGLHNQAHVFDGTRHFSAGVTNAHQAWAFIHAKSGALVCASRIDDPFGAASTGKVHAGGGLVANGALLTAVSNEADGERGAVALLRVEPPASGPAKTAAPPPCTTT